MLSAGSSTPGWSPHLQLPSTTFRVNTSPFCPPPASHFCLPHLGRTPRPASLVFMAMRHVTPCQQCREVMGALPPRSAPPRVGDQTRTHVTHGSAGAGSAWARQKGEPCSLWMRGWACWMGTAGAGGARLKLAEGGRRAQWTVGDRERRALVLTQCCGHSLCRGVPTSHRRTSSRRRWWSRSMSVTRRPWAPSSTTCAAGRTPTGCGAGPPGGVSGRLHPLWPLP